MGARLPLMSAIFALAFLARLLPVLRGGGLGFFGRYDDGVYYAASDALSFGHAPYRDFVLLHPPGSTLALLPFTLLGRATSDPIGMTTARLSFMAIGSLNAVLVALIATRWGRLRGVFAGLIYAGSAAAIYSEQATFLEPLGSLLVLAALLAYYRGLDRPRPRTDLLVGVLLGLACTVKIWYVAPFVALVLAIVLAKRLGSALRVLAAGAVASTVVLGPFFALAPGRMWTMVVVDQVGRHGNVDPTSGRFASILGTKTLLAHDADLRGIVTVALVVLTIVALVLCTTDRRTWPLVLFFLATAITLLASPSYFRHYGVFLAAPIALVLAIGLGDVLRRWRWRPARGAVLGVCGVVVIAAGVAAALAPTGRPFPGARFAAAAPSGCIAADDPAGLIQINRLSSDLRQGCDVPIDVTGASYGSALPRSQNAAFHRWLSQYLLHSAAFVILRPKRDALPVDQKAALHRQPTLAQAGGLTLRAGDGASSPS